MESQAIFFSKHSVIRLSLTPEVEFPRSAVSPPPGSLLLNVGASKPNFVQALPLRCVHYVVFVFIVDRDQMSTSTLTELFRILPVLLEAWVPQVTVVSVLLPGLAAERDALAFVAFRACGIYSKDCEAF